MTRGSAAAIFTTLCIFHSSVCFSQDRVIPLETGDRAPHAGMLVLDDDLYQLQRDRLLLTAERDQLLARIAETAASQLRLDAARDAASAALVSLHDGLWRQQAERLQREIAAASEPWRSPWLWAAIGLAVGVAASVAIGLAFGGG